jgi:phosphatidylinositol kinase/protein kinase (PI-3  family)
MKVLRDNKESLMAVLEAFVYDPLINWRLMQTDAETRPPDRTFPLSQLRVPVRLICTITQLS